MTTPFLQITEWVENQNQPHIPVNTAVRTLEVFSCFVVVQDRMSQPSGSPDEEEGDAFIVEGGTGDWATHDLEIAYYSNGLKFALPREGMLAWVINTEELLQYSELPTAGPGWYTFVLPGGLAAEPYDVGSMLNGVPTASQVLMRYPFPRTVVFPAGLTGSRGVAAVAATAQTDFDIKKGAASVGTMRFAASGTVATFIMATETTFSPGDVLTVVAPGSADATLASVGFALVGER
jgi:hypothetical protein